MKTSTFVMLVCASAMMLWGCDAKTKADLDAARNKAKETKTKAEDTKNAGEQEASDKICEQAPTLHKTALDREISVYYRAGLAPLYTEMDLKAHAEDPSKELTPNSALASAADWAGAPFPAAASLRPKERGPLMVSCRFGRFGGELSTPRGIY